MKIIAPNFKPPPREISTESIFVCFVLFFKVLIISKIGAEPGANGGCDQDKIHRPPSFLLKSVIGLTFRITNGAPLKDITDLSSALHTSEDNVKP